MEELKVLKALGIVFMQYVVARVLVAIFVPSPFADIFARVVDIWVIVALIVAVLSLVTGGNDKIMKKLNAIASAALVLAIVVGIGFSLWSNRDYNPNLIPPPSPSEPVNPNPAPTEPSDPANPPPDPTAPSQPATPTPAPTTPAPPSQPRNNYFVMGEDNYSFANVASNFGYPKNYGIPIERFKLIFTDSEAETYSKWKGYSPWKGNCYGFAASSSLFDKGTLSHANYQSGVNMTYRFNSPRNNRTLLELIELYQISQTLIEVSSAAKANEDNYSGLISAMYNADGTVKRSGLLLSVGNADGGHAVVAYDIRNSGNGVYVISIYDNNYPNDRNRNMVVDTAHLAWTYDSYSNSRHYFRFLDSSVVYSSIQAALARRATPANSAERTDNNMIIIVPDGVTATQNGTPISELESAYYITPATNTETLLAPIWCLPDGGIVDFEVAGTAEGVAVFDELVSYMITADAAVIAGSTVSGITVDSENSFEVLVVRNGDAPLALFGRSAETFSVADEDGELVLNGSGRIRARQGNRQAILALRAGSPIVFDGSVLRIIIPWYVYAFVGIAVIGGVVLLIWRIKVKRD